MRACYEHITPIYVIEFTAEINLAQPNFYYEALSNQQILPSAPSRNKCSAKDTFGARWDCKNFSEIHHSATIPIPSFFTPIAHVFSKER